MCEGLSKPHQVHQLHQDPSAEHPGLNSFRDRRYFEVALEYGAEFFGAQKAARLAKRSAMTTLNAGAVMLDEICATNTIVAVSAKTQRKASRIGHYKSGRRKPDPETRAIFRDAYGIAVDAWDQPCDRAVLPSPTAEASPDRTTSAGHELSLTRPGLTSHDRAKAIVVRIEGEIAACGPNVPVNHKASLYGQLQTAVGALSKLDGDGEITAGALLRSRAWAEVSEVLERVLRKYPGAAEDLRDALAAISGGR